MDWGRVGKMALVGFVFDPLNHGWYTFLDRALRGRTLYTIIRKVLADQLVFAPIVINSFFITICTLEGVHIKETMRELQVKFWPTYMVDWAVWPAAQTSMSLRSIELHISQTIPWISRENWFVESDLHS